MFHFTHRGGIKVTLRAGNSPHSLVGNSTEWSVHQTRFDEGAGAGRWHQKIALEHVPSFSWRGDW